MVIGSVSQQVSTIYNKKKIGLPQSGNSVFNSEFKITSRSAGNNFVKLGLDLCLNEFQLCAIYRKKKLVCLNMAIRSFYFKKESKLQQVRPGIILLN